jgi:hypothetical protein
MQEPVKIVAIGCLVGRADYRAYIQSVTAWGFQRGSRSENDVELLDQSLSRVVMSASIQPRVLRLTTLGCGLTLLLVLHVSVRYLVMTLFGYVTFEGLAPFVPWLVLGGYFLLLGGVAVATTVRQGRLSGLGLGAGFLIMMSEFVISSIVWGDGCEVSATVGPSLVSGWIIAPMTMRIVLLPWNGACTVTLFVPGILLGIAIVGIGLWLGEIPAKIASEWMSFLDNFPRIFDG